MFFFNVLFNLLIDTYQKGFMIKIIIILNTSYKLLCGVVAVDTSESVVRSTQGKQTCFFFMMSPVN